MIAIIIRLFFFHYLMKIIQNILETCNKHFCFRCEIKMGRHNRQKNTVVVVVQEQGFVPIRMVCPYCHSKVLTEIRYKDGLLTYILCCGLVLFGYFIFD